MRQIEKLLKDQIAPALAAHGGAVELVDVDNNKVFIKLTGGCQGCSQVTTTVKDGVEKVILQHFPEFKGVMDVTNHASGENPYYR